MSPLLSLARPISLVVLFTGAPGLICINYGERETSEDAAETPRRESEGGEDKAMANPKCLLYTLLQYRIETYPWQSLVNNSNYKNFVPGKSFADSDNQIM